MFDEWLSEDRRVTWDPQEDGSWTPRLNPWNAPGKQFNRNFPQPRTRPKTWHKLYLVFLPHVYRVRLKGGG